MRKYTHHLFKKWITAIQASRRKISAGEKIIFRKIKIKKKIINKSIIFMELVI